MNGRAQLLRFQPNRSKLLPFAAACLMVSCAAERRNSGAEPELEARQPPPTAPLSAPAPKSAQSVRKPELKISNVSPGRFALEANAPTQVASEGALERRADDGSWIPVPFRLRRDCAPVADSVGSNCLYILPEQPLVALSWNGAECGPCCYAEWPVPLVPGEYRLAPRACGGANASWEGPAFAMPGTSYVLERLRAAAHIEKASVFKLLAPGPQDALGNDTPDPSKIIGRPIVAGSEAVLSPEHVSLLGEWLRSPTGFNNIYQRRCGSGERYGFRLTRNVPKVGYELSELAIELHCNKITIVNQEGTLRPLVHSYFDESRAELLALLRQAVLPALREALPER